MKKAQVNSSLFGLGAKKLTGDFLVEKSFLAAIPCPITKMNS
jgi:hypothetical protein